MRGAIRSVEFRGGTGATLGGVLHLPVHAADDEVVPLAQGEALFAAASEPTFQRLASGGHLLDRPSADAHASDAAVRLAHALRHP